MTGPSKRLVSACRAKLKKHLLQSASADRAASPRAMKPYKAGGDDAVVTTMNFAKRFPSLTVFGLALALHSNCVGNGVVWDDRAAVRRAPCRPTRS